MFTTARRLITDFDIQQPWTLPKYIKSNAIPQFKIEGSSPSIQFIYPGVNTATLRLSSSAQKIDIPEWGAYLNPLKTGNLIPVFEAKQISEVSTTAATELDRVFVLAESIPPNINLILYLRGDVYNNGGATSCIRAVFGGATVELCTTSTAYVTLTGSATVPNLVNDWLILSISQVAAATAFVKLTAALIIPKAV